MTTACDRALDLISHIVQRSVLKSCVGYFQYLDANNGCEQEPRQGGCSVPVRQWVSSQAEIRNT